MTRRDLLTSAVVAGFPAIVPSRVLGQSAPSNLIQVAQIGCGRIARGSEMAGLLKNADSARYVAVCDLDTVRVADAKQLIEGSYAKQFGSGNYAQLKTYTNYREMLQDKSIDAVCASARPTIGMRSLPWRPRWPVRTCTCRSPLRSLSTKAGRWRIPWVSRAGFCKWGANSAPTSRFATPANWCATGASAG